VNLDLMPVESGTACVDCKAPAIGIRRNLDREPTCELCEADRQAMIMLLLEAAGDDGDGEYDLVLGPDAAVPTQPSQLGMFDEHIPAKEPT
jgi:hypothetical protein